jgi:Xaa-Pro aminopeptidase
VISPLFASLEQSERQQAPVAEAGMVFAVEVLSYTPDVGAIMIEDLVEVTQETTWTLHTLPRTLEVVG